MKMMIAGAALAAAPLGVVHAQMAMPGQEHPMSAQAHQAMSNMPGMTMDQGADYAAGSGTSRVPANDMMQGVHAMAGDWMLMAHGYAWATWTDQGGPRGDEMAYVQSMAMVEASHPLGSAARLQLRAMLSLDPLMGRRGYPNLFATGETANGVPLVDRQHPHDLFMELSGRIDVDVADRQSLFLYAAPAGEPALGPPAFMHRGSARFLAQAPIGHHWFDSTHIAFGVLTAGYAAPHWQLEGSIFNAREPDERRWNIESGRLNSWSARLSWTPSPRWSAQLSYGALRSPERQHPDRDERRATASLGYAAGRVSATIGYSRKDLRPGPVLDAWLGEATWAITPRHAVFGRVENILNDELFEADETSPLHGRSFRVTRLTAGYAYTLPLGDVATLALGIDASVYANPRALDTAYGDAPKSVSVFAKLALGKGD